MTRAMILLEHVAPAFHVLLCLLLMFVFVAWAVGREAWREWA